MAAQGFGAVDKVTKAGDSMTGTLSLTAVSPLQITTTTPGTGKVLVSDASGNAAWGTAGSSGVTVPLSLSGSQAASSILSVANTAAAPSVEAVVVTSQTAGDRAVGIQVTGDTNKRHSVDSNGAHSWGPGNAALDTNLYRSAVGTLKTDNSLLVVGSVTAASGTVNGSLTLSGGAANLTAGGTAAATGGMQVGSGTPAFGGGSGVLGMSNATSVPTTNPASGLVMYADQDTPKWRSSNGDVYPGNGGWRDDTLKPTGAIAETMPRWATGSSNASPPSGYLNLMPIWLPKGAVISNFNWFTTSGGATSPTHQWAGLYNAGRGQLALTSNKTTTAIPGLTAFTWAVATIASGPSTTFTTTYTGLHYVGLMITATTPPSVGGQTVNTGGYAPMFGTSDSGQTTPPAFPRTVATPISANPLYIYMYVS